MRYIQFVNSHAILGDITSLTHEAIFTRWNVLFPWLAVTKQHLLSQIRHFSCYGILSKSFKSSSLSPTSKTLSDYTIPTSLRRFCANCLWYEHSGTTYKLNKLFPTFQKSSKMCNSQQNVTAEELLAAINQTFT